RRNQRQEECPDLIEAVVGHIRPHSCLPLVLMPATAVIVYTPVAVWNLNLPTNWALYVVTMPLGFVCLLGSLWVVVRGRRCPAELSGLSCPPERGIAIDQESEADEKPPPTAAP